MVSKIDRGLIVVLAATVSWTVSGTALASPCSPPKSAATASLQLQFGEPQYVYDLDTAGIRKVVSDRQGYVAGSWHIPLGLTVVDLGMVFETEFFVRKTQGAGYCVALADAKVTVGYTNLTVYISSDYGEGSCEFDAILAHEQEQLQINQGVLEAYKAKFKDALKRVLRSKMVIFVHHKAAARDAYILRLRRKFKPLVSEMKSALARKNGAIDTEKSYRRVAAQCNGWLVSDLQVAGSETGSRQTKFDDSATDAYERGDFAAGSETGFGQTGFDDSPYDTYNRGDYAAAYREWLPLAEQGIAAAQYNLAVMFANGEGVTQNNVLAYALFDLAAADDPEAAEQRDSMAREMAAEEINRAARLADRVRADDTAMFLGEVLGAALPANPGPEIESAGPSLELVWAVQEALTALGYDAGAADGMIGPRTRAAVRAFQADTGLGADGQVSEQLLRRLRSGFE